MSAPFEAAWLRIDRAAEHHNAAAEVWNSWIDQEPYLYVVDDQGQGKFALQVVQTRLSPPELAIYIGEWLYNLRCALDYAVYDAAICVTGKNPPSGKSQLQYPVYFDEASYRENEYRLKPLADHHRNLIEEAQPYRHDDPDTSALGWLHKLARIDRHRSLHLMTAYAAEMNPIVGVPSGCAVEFEFGTRVVLKDQTEVGCFRVTPWRDGWKVDVDARTGLDPEIAEWAVSPFWRRVGYNERLLMLETVVKTLVIPLEYDCTGFSRRADLLTDAYRAECDARRQDRSTLGRW